MLKKPKNLDILFPPFVFQQIYFEKPHERKTNKEIQRYLNVYHHDPYSNIFIHTCQTVTRNEQVHVLLCFQNITSLTFLIV